MKLKEFFEIRAVFTHVALAEFLDSAGPRSARTRESLLAYYVRAGRLIRIRRGLYATVPPGVRPRDCRVDPYLLASKMADDAVLAYGAALALHAAWSEPPARLVYLTRRASRPVWFRRHRYRGAFFPKALRDAGNEVTEVESARRAGTDIRVTSLPRTMVDMLHRPRLCGGWRNVWRCLHGVDAVDVERVVRYALLLGNATTVAKVGFYLNKRRDVLGVDDASLAALQRHRPRRPHYLVRGDGAGGRLVAEWNLVVPASALSPL
jgi:predicted transcriptional regulator of viral defense system